MNLGGTIKRRLLAESCQSMAMPVEMASGLNVTACFKIVFQRTLVEFRTVEFLVRYSTLC